MRTLFLNHKGGTGKSTSCVCVAMAMAKVGRQVALMDLDPQQSATEWLERCDSGVEAYNPAKEYDVVVVDTPPRPVDEVVRQVTLADRILLVSSPSPAELTVTRNVVATVLDEEAIQQRARVLFNRVRPRTMLGRELGDIAGMIGLPMLQCFLSLRECYAHVPLKGWDALNADAEREVLNLALEVATLDAAPIPAGA